MASLLLVSSINSSVNNPFIVYLLCNFVSCHLRHVKLNYTEVESHPTVLKEIIGQESPKLQSTASVPLQQNKSLLVHILKEIFYLRYKITQSMFTYLMESFFYITFGIRNDS